MADPIQPQDLAIHVLNVGFGDTIVVELPANGQGLRRHGLVDCCQADKARAYLEQLAALRPAEQRLAFICATHPHADHIAGILPFLEDPDYRPQEFWDSGFRHNSRMYQAILQALYAHQIRMMRVSSGMEWYFGRVCITALAPSVALRNRFATYGVDMNNASIVLRLEHYREAVVLTESVRYEGTRDPAVERQAGRSVVILGGDAEFDSWACISTEFPRLERTSEHDPLVKKMVNLLACAVVKVPHHGSMHSISLDMYERMSPELAVISTRQAVSSHRLAGRMLKRGLFPHRTAALALEEVGAQVVTTDGSYEAEMTEGRTARDPQLAHPGSVVVVVPPAGQPRWIKLQDTESQVPQPPVEV